MARREWRTAGVESGPKSSIVNVVEQGKAVSLARPRDRADLTARRVRRNSIGKTEKLRPVVTHEISPRRSGLKWQESTSNRCSLRKQMTTDARRLMRLKAVAQRSTASWRLGADTVKRGSAPAGQPHRGWPYEDLSRMKGNFHVRF